MTIRPPLKKPKIKSIDIDALIEKGANVKEDCKSEEMKKWSFINLRIESKMIKNVDRCVSNRVGITRTGWILEAIDEKIRREI
jgi:hypothetical protein